MLSSDISYFFSFYSFHRSSLRSHRDDRLKSGVRELSSTTEDTRGLLSFGLRWPAGPYRGYVLRYGLAATGKRRPRIKDRHDWMTRLGLRRQSDGRHTPNATKVMAPITGRAHLAKGCHRPSGNGMLLHLPGGCMRIFTSHNASPIPKCGAENASTGNG